MDIHVEKKTISTASGTGSENTLPLIGGIMRQLYVLAGTSTTSFEFDVTNEDSLVIRAYDMHRGEINDHSNHLPVSGIYTLRVFNANADGDFTIAMLVQQ